MLGSPLPTGWRWSTLGEVKCPDDRAIVSGPFGSNIGSRFFVTSGVPVIRGNNLTMDMTRFIDEDFVFVTEEKAAELSGCIAVPGDLVFTAAGSLGQVGIIPRRSRYPRYVISNKQMRARLDPEVVDELFAFYWFSSPTIVRHTQQRNTGSSVPLINLSILRALPIPLPPLPEQRAIADILGSLDDKIELNRRMNETLEQIAQATFRSWFVDFDPVRAKAEGRQPAGMDAATAALFPDSFEDSPLGEIPRGWDARPLDSVAEFLNGLAMQKYSPEGDEYLPVIKIAELRSGVTSSSGRGSVGIPPEYVVDDGDVLFSWSGSLEVVIWCGGKGALNQHLFKVTSREYPRWFYYFWIRQHLPMFRDIASDKATTMGHIRRHHLSEALVVAPPQPVLDAADSLLSPLLARFVANCQQSRTLAAIRDALLPKLMSGEVRVREAE